MLKFPCQGLRLLMNTNMDAQLNRMLVDPLDPRILSLPQILVLLQIAITNIFLFTIINIAVFLLYAIRRGPQLFVSYKLTNNIFIWEVYLDGHSRRLPIG